MELSANKIKVLAGESGVKLNDLLKRAGVSKTAYYSLLRKDSVLPKSIHLLARQLNVNPSDLLFDSSLEREKMLMRSERVKSVLAENPGLDPDNVRHTLFLLEMEPEERLRRALLRGQTFNFH